MKTLLSLSSFPRISSFKSTAYEEDKNTLRSVSFVVPEAMKPSVLDLQPPKQPLQIRLVNPLADVDKEPFFWRHNLEDNLIYFQKCLNEQAKRWQVTYDLTKQHLKVLQKGDTQYLMTNSFVYGNFGKICLAGNTITKDTFLVKQFKLQENKQDNEKTLRTQISEINNECTLFFEANTAAPFLDWAKIENKVYIFMPIFRGNILQILKHLNNTDNDNLFQDYRTILSLGRQISQKIAACHKKGIIYCDLKMDNLLISHDGKFDLADFNQSLSISSADLTFNTKEFERISFGTSGYRSPEYFNAPFFNQKIDVWSLGITLLYLWSNNTIEILEDAQKCEHETINDYCRWFEQQSKIKPINQTKATIYYNNIREAILSRYQTNHSEQTRAEVQDILNFIMTQMMHPDPKKRANMIHCYKFFQDKQPENLTDDLLIRSKLIHKAVDPKLAAYREAFKQTVENFFKINPN